MPTMTEVLDVRSFFNINTAVVTGVESFSAVQTLNIFTLNCSA